MMNTLYTQAVLAVCCTLLGVAQTPAVKKAPEFGVRGRIEKIAPPPTSGPKRSTVLGYVTISGKKHPDTETDRAVVIVLKSTRIQRLANGKVTAARFADLKPGQRVQARFQPGPRILIYPPRVAATEITILSGTAAPAAKSSPRAH